ncbi:MAG: CTP-dependent riboflavin kinase [Candidatus Bathyarchaeota archaeon]|nr:MAG: CTP-dependent riboflavin kinase [Candidatus Bathyarchaeota archaeon]
MKEQLWHTLYNLAQLGAIHNSIQTSTTQLAKILDVSQQTASRHVIELEKAGHITKRTSFKGMELKITRTGTKELQKVYLSLKTVFESQLTSITLTLTGVVFSGLREGMYYVSQSGYSQQFRRKLGYTPYPGTLNLRLASPAIDKKRELLTYPSIEIKGFQGLNRRFGDVQCYPVLINSQLEGAAIIIDRTHYDESVIEIISSVHLRSALNVTDGDVVTLDFSLRTG